ncbi:MAG: glycosyltransferase family 4 protein [Thermofilaceae archaeon]
MKVVIVSRQLNLRQSAPKCCLYLAFELSELGAEVHVVTSIVTAEAYNKLRGTRNVRIHKLHSISIDTKLSPFFYTQAAWRLKSKYSADVILGNGYTLFDDITWVHSPHLAPIVLLGLRNWRLHVKASLEKLLFKTSKLLLAPSSLVAKNLVELYGTPSTKIVISPHGVDTEYYSPLPRDKRGYLKTEGKVRLLFVGEDPLLKGFHLLLKGLTYIRRLKDLELIVVGFNPDLNMWSLVDKLGLSRVVSFYGVVSAEKLRELYRSSDIFVLPTLYDAFSLTSLEAMACGLPVVLSPYAGIRDIVRNWYNGVIVNPLNASQLAEAITTLVYDDRLRERIGANARATAESLSWRNVARKILGFMEELKGR